MGARRSKKSRTIVVPVRGFRRPRSVSTMLLSFALLAVITTQGAAGRGPGLRGVPVPSRKAAIASSARAAVGSSSDTTIATVSHQPQLLPPLSPPRFHPKPVAAALNQDAASGGSKAMVATAPPDVGAVSLVSIHPGEGATAIFLAYAAESSRTRGQPVSDC